MKKTVKILWLALALAFTVGIVLMAAGFFAGASLGMYVDGGGLHVSEQGGGAGKTEEADLESFNKIKLNVDNADVKIVEAEKNGLEITYYGAKPSYSVTDGTLIIAKNEEHAFNIFDFGPIFEKGNEIVIFREAGEALDDIDLQVACGGITGSGVRANTMRCADSMGDVRLESVEIGKFTGKLNAGNLKISDSIFTSIAIENDLGDVNLRNVTASDSTISLNAGKVEAKGDFGNVRINNDLGDIVLSTVNPKGQYQYDLSVDLGGIKIDGDSFRGSVRGSSETGALKYHDSLGGPWRLECSANCGNIEVNFENR